jgi:predicted membrane channel-forming protein YqfA (hemolysin III family)
MVRADSTGMASAVSRPMLFDTRRGLYYPKPALRGWLHLLWFEASLVVGTLLLVHAHGARQIIAVAIFAASVTGLFGISALYHRGNWGSLASRWLQRLDHVMIFLLIAGTGTAAFLPTAPKLYAAVGLSVLCGLTLAAIVNASGVDERAGEARRGDLHRAGASEARRSADAHRASALRLSLTVHRR